MSDDLDIRSGGAVAVDTATLRSVADCFAVVARGLDGVRAALVDESRRLLELDPALDAVGWGFASVAVRAEGARDAADSLAMRLRRVALLYEIVELRVERDAAAAAGDLGAVTRADARLAALACANPGLYREAVLTQQLAWLAGANAFVAEASDSPFGAFGASAAAAVMLAAGGFSRGRIPRDAVLSGPRTPVDVQQVGGRPTAARAPTSLVSIVDRMPAGEAQVRVERYGMPDGSRRFAVYVTGTRSYVDAAEPWNWESNTQLYTGQRSASYDATVLALQRAGAQPGDAVYGFGHSQGAMVAGHLALEEGYDARALVTFGSPVAADVGSGTLSVQVRHTDDVVAALAAGGSPAGVGSDGSFVAERVADPSPGLQAGVHDLAEYRETAAMIDRSSDPRAEALDGLFAELSDAETIEVFEYAATRGAVMAPGHDDAGPPAA